MILLRISNFSAMLITRSLLTLWKGFENVINYFYSQYWLTIIDNIYATFPVLTDSISRALLITQTYSDYESLWISDHLCEKDTLCESYFQCILKPDSWCNKKGPHPLECRQGTYLTHSLQGRRRLVGRVGKPRFWHISKLYLNQRSEGVDCAPTLLLAHPASYLTHSLYVAKY